MTGSTYEIFYDEDSDLLEVFFGESSKCYADEIEKGIFIRKDKETHEIKSVEILNFKKRGTKIFKEILERINMRFPLEINV